MEVTKAKIKLAVILDPNMEKSDDVTGCLFQVGGHKSWSVTDYIQPFH